MWNEHWSQENKLKKSKYRDNSMENKYITEVNLGRI